MNKDKVYLKGYVIGRAVDTLGYQGLMVQLENLDVVEIDKNLVHKEIDEPQKVTVPQIVADYIKYTKDADWDLQEAMDDVAYEDNKDLRKWFNNNIETFARAWLDGYEIEKEKRYIVKVKGADEGYNYLNYRISSESWFFSGESEPLDFRVKHTRKELEKASFGWIFDCKGIEVKEVKE